MYVLAISDTCQILVISKPNSTLLAGTFSNPSVYSTVPAHALHCRMYTVHSNLGRRVSSPVAVLLDWEECISESV